mmetsp:Transcript_7449/g.16460  ORF Transcript_7449/g.16460 Transcript_7449/m.16460 type:complete len:213 (-) Transcript_7449:14-652(-)
MSDTAFLAELNPSLASSTALAAPALFVSATFTAASPAARFFSFSVISLCSACFFLVSVFPRIPHASFSKPFLLFFGVASAVHSARSTIDSASHDASLLTSSTTVTSLRCRSDSKCRGRFAGSSLWCVSTRFIHVNGLMCSPLSGGLSADRRARFTPHRRQKFESSLKMLPHFGQDRANACGSFSGVSSTCAILQNQYLLPLVQRLSGCKMLR